MSGTAKVSPMIKGHVISTPRIRLNRLTEELRGSPTRSLPVTLSPIMEVSPNTSPIVDQTLFHREVRIPLKRLELDELRKPPLSDGTCTINTSSKFRIFRRETPGYELRKHYNSFPTSHRVDIVKRKLDEASRGIGDDNTEDESDDDRILGDRVIAEDSHSNYIPHSNRNSGDDLKNHVDDDDEDAATADDDDDDDDDDNDDEGEEEEDEYKGEEEDGDIEMGDGPYSQNTPNDNSGTRENHVHESTTQLEEEDPLEGPSWMLDQRARSKKRSSVGSSVDYGYVNYRRPNHVYSFNATLNDDDNGGVLNYNDNARMGNFGMEEEKREERLSVNKESSGMVHLSGDCSSSTTAAGEKLDSEVNGYSSRAESVRCSSDRRRSLRNSVKTGSPIDGNDVLKICSILLERITPAKKSTPARVTPRRSSLRISLHKPETPNIRRNDRSKRRAAELCKQQKNWIEITPKEKKNERKRSRKRNTSPKRKQDYKRRNSKNT